MYKDFLQSLLCCFISSHSSCCHYITIKDLVSMFKGSLTILSRSMHYFSSSHTSHVASSLVFVILFSSQGWSSSGSAENICVIVVLASLSTSLFAWGPKRHNTKECKVRPPRDIHTVFWPTQGVFLLNTLPTSPSETDDVVLIRSKPNKKLRGILL